MVVAHLKKGSEEGRKVPEKDVLESRGLDRRIPRLIRTVQNSQGAVRDFLVGKRVV